MENENKKFYNKTWFIVLILIVFWPIGLILMWTNSEWEKRTKIIVTVVMAILCVVAVMSPKQPAKVQQPTVKVEEAKKAAAKVEEAEKNRKAEISSAKQDYEWAMSKVTRDVIAAYYKGLGIHPDNLDFSVVMDASVESHGDIGKYESTFTLPNGWKKGFSSMWKEGRCVYIRVDGVGDIITDHDAPAVQEAYKKWKDLSEKK